MIFQEKTHQYFPSRLIPDTQKTRETPNCKNTSWFPNSQLSKTIILNFCSRGSLDSSQPDEGNSVKTKSILFLPLEFCFWKIWRISIVKFIILKNHCIDFFHQTLNRQLSMFGGFSDWKHQFFAYVERLVLRKCQEMLLFWTYFDTQIQNSSTLLTSLLLERSRKTVFDGRRLLALVLLKRSRSTVFDWRRRTSVFCTCETWKDENAQKFIDSHRYWFSNS